jgi:ABC-type antimicrobial peptide transport system permease subunit
VGDSLTIYGSEFRVSGIVQMPESTFATVWMSLETAENTFHTRGIYQGAVVVIPAGANPDEVLFLIESLPDLKNRYAAFLMDDVYFRFARALESARIISLVLTWIALFRITFGVYHTIQLNLEERGRELILLHAAGLCIRDLQKLLLARIAFLAVISFFLGWAVASVIINRFEKISPIVLHGEHIPVLLDQQMLLVGFSFTLVFCVLGVWLPTRKISTAGVMNLSGD